MDFGLHGLADEQAKARVAEAGSSATGELCTLVLGMKFWSDTEHLSLAQGAITCVNAWYTAASNGTLAKALQQPLPDGLFDVEAAKKMLKLGDIESIKLFLEQGPTDTTDIDCAVVQRFFMEMLEPQLLAALLLMAQGHGQCRHRTCQTRRYVSIRNAEDSGGGLRRRIVAENCGACHSPDTPPTHD